VSDDESLNFLFIVGAGLFIYMAVALFLVFMGVE